jgi:hypothetical protein
VENGLPENEFNYLMMKAKCCIEKRQYAEAKQHLENQLAQFGTDADGAHQNGILRKIDLLKKMIENGDVVEDNSVQKLNKKVDIIPGSTNIFLLDASIAVKLVYDKIKGRHLVATHRILPGIVVQYTTFNNYSSHYTINF